MQTPWDASQTAALSHQGSAVLLGATGSGKTSLLVEKVAALLAQGVSPDNIALTTFAHRAMQALKIKLAVRVGPQATKIRVNTMVELAQAQLEAVGQQPVFVTNNQVRLMLRGIMREAGFPGTLIEASETIHFLKSQRNKPDGKHPFDALYRAYTRQLDSQRLADRNDVLRSHLQGLKGGSVPPVPVGYLLVDNVQDATPLQLAWLKAHLDADITLLLAANDDLTAYASDGAAGAAGIREIQGWPSVHIARLTETYRIPAIITPPLERLMASIPDRLSKPATPHNSHQASITVQAFATASDEHAFLAAKARELAGGEPQSVGLITRTDEHANLLAHLLRKQGFNPASYARLIWEEPPAQKVLALLYLLLGSATDSQLHLVLQGFGCTADTTARLAAEGLSADDWLARGGPFPDVAAYDAATKHLLAKAHRSLWGAWQVLQAKTLGAREVFKGVLEAMLAHQPLEALPTMLLAADMLLSLSGKLSEVLPRVMQETMPDMTAPLVVAPVREVRNLEFKTVLIPHAQPGHWPRPVSTGLPEAPEHERHLFYLALSRTKGDILITHHGHPTPLVAELQENLVHSN